MATEILTGELTRTQVRRLESAGLLVRRMGGAAGGGTRWQVSGTAAESRAILNAETDDEALRRIALQRCPPVPVPADLLAVLIQSALGQPLSASETKLLQDQLAGLLPIATRMQQLRQAKTSAEVEAVGGKLWPT